MISIDDGAGNVWQLERATYAEVKLTAPPMRTEEYPGGPRHLRVPAETCRLLAAALVALAHEAEHALDRATRRS